MTQPIEMEVNHPTQQKRIIEIAHPA